MKTHDATCGIGMAGLDTSHVPAFAGLLHDSTKEYHVPGARIAAAFPGGSPDFDLSINRVGQFTADCSLLTIDCKGYDYGTDMVVRVTEIAPQR